MEAEHGSLKGPLPPQTGGGIHFHVNHSECSLTRGISSLPSLEWAYMVGDQYSFLLLKRHSSPYVDLSISTVSLLDIFLYIKLRRSKFEAMDGDPGARQWLQVSLVPEIKQPRQESK